MLSIKITIDKDDALRKIQHASDSFRSKVTDAIVQSAYLIRNTVVEGMQRGGRSGRLYRRGKGKFHQASGPGEFPKSDTGYMASHILVNKFDLMAEVGTTAKYGEFLEYKDPMHGGRPWLQPSIDKNEKEIVGILDLALMGLFK